MLSNNDVKAISGALLWCIAAYLIRISEPNFFLVSLLFISTILLSKSKSWEPVLNDLLVFLKLLATVAVGVGVAVVVRPVGKIEVIISQIFQNNTVFLSSCVVAVLQMAILIRDNINNKYLKNEFNKSEST